MGIPGIYKQIGPGERIALSKLACEHLEKTGRPFRIAIDISIWSFQIQSGQGGRNPALRTLYYRLLRLLALAIQPLFVFDGPHKPSFKRGKKIAPGAACLPDFLTKELLKRFGFPYHTAPGEAEAECALLQKEGIVDAVLSEDVDTLMFGCGLSLRNWTAEGARGNKSPTHVNVYDARTTKATAGLDSNGMILVAMMSGGDYIPAGIPGCGPKTACEAAKAGFGKDLCSLVVDNIDGFREWRERLQGELQTNKSKLFRQKHKALSIPESFPDMTVLGYYMRPAVSSKEKLCKLRKDITWNEPVNISDLRLFVAEAFNWPYLIGAKKFIRGLAPALLARQLIQRSLMGTGDNQSLEDKELSESRVVKAICGRRSHWNTDGTPELRIAYIPNGIVGVDLEAEEDEMIEGYGQEGSEDEQPASGVEDDRDRSRSPAKKRGPSAYDPTAIEKIWVLESFVKLGVPLLVESWEEDMRNPTKFASRKARERKVVSKANAVTKPGAMEQFVQLSKPGVEKPIKAKGLPKQSEKPSLPPVFLAPATANMPRSPHKAPSGTAHPVMQKCPSKATKEFRSRNTKPKEKPSAAQILPLSPTKSTHNPWTLSKRPSDTLRYKSPTRYSALGIYPPNDPDYNDHTPQCSGTPSMKPSSLASPPISPTLTPRKRRSRPTTPISDIEAEKQHQAILTDTIEHQTTPRRRGGLMTPSTRNSERPSPRKKRSPLEMANDLYLAGKLRTPTSIRKERHSNDPASFEVVQLTAKKVNRKIDFSENPQHIYDAVSPVSELSLPSPSVLLSPTSPPKGIGVAAVNLEVSTEAEIVVAKSLEVKSDEVRTEKAKRYVALRESLEGAWKRVESWEVVDIRKASGRGREMEKGRRGVYSGVEILDLTGE